jgi:nucleotide-binding universal stress UspA family protein
MTYKTILLHLDERSRRTERLEMAVRLAEAFDAHLLGAFAAGEAFVPAPVLAEAGPAAAEIRERARRDMASRAETEFTETAKRGAVRFGWQVGSANGYDELIAGARCADLVVTGQPETGDERHFSFCGDLLLGAGRPVLFVPYAGRFTRVGQRVLVAWNGSREAARAIADALPFLARAAEVNVVQFEDARGEPFLETIASDLGAWLGRHGVKTSIARYGNAGIDAGNHLLSRAADLGADLIVMGGYGHSRMRELVLGGVTRTLLESMTVPVLMSH